MSPVHKPAQARRPSISRVISWVFRESGFEARLKSRRQP